MSSGPVGEGMSYWATIKITKEMDKEKLREVVSQIQALLRPHNGSIVSETRASSKALASFSLRAPDGPPPGR
jgi:hypothetical protein